MAFTCQLHRMPQLVLLSLLALTACKPATPPSAKAPETIIADQVTTQPQAPFRFTSAKTPVLSTGENAPAPAPAPETVITPILRCMSDRTSALAGEAIQIDCGLTGGNRSFDAFNFTWSVRHAGIEESLGSSASPQLTYTPTTVGSFRFEILAEDGETHASTALDVTIEPPPLSVSCPETLQITLGQTATLNCSVRNASVDASAVEMSWTLLSTPVSVVLPTLRILARLITDSGPS